MPVGSDGLSYEQRRAAARGGVRLGNARPRRGLGRRARVSGELPLASGRRRARSRSARAARRGRARGERHAERAHGYLARRHARAVGSRDRSCPSCSAGGYRSAACTRGCSAFPIPRSTQRRSSGTDGTLASFEQRLWRVAFASYQLAPAKADTGSPLLVPRRIDLEHGDLRLRLTIDDWHAGAP